VWKIFVVFNILFQVYRVIRYLYRVLKTEYETGSKDLFLAVGPF